jgi:LytR cell envelope-related transcriptional attenuator
MEHSLPGTQVAPHWRTATLVASGVAAVELLILLVIGLPMLGHSVSSHVRTAAENRVFAPEPEARPQQVQKDKTRLLPRRQTAIIVLNGNGRSGAAAQEGRKVHRLGYRIAGVGNASRTDYAHTIVMYRPGRRDEAQRLAKDVHARVVAPLDGMRLRDMMGAHVALVLGSA